MNKDILLFPCYDFGITKNYQTGTHLGVDFGWIKDANCDVLSVQDGIVVDNFSNDSVGNAVVVQHNYPDGTHRFTGYIHLKNKSSKKIGTEVKQGESIGIRGNTGKSNGTHLHIYVSAVTTEVYNWNTMKGLCTFDPLPLFYLSRKYQYNLSIKLKDLKYIEDAIIKEIRDELERSKNTIEKLLEKI